MSNKVLGGSLLITGSAIGAGVLAVPVLTAQSGFFPATFLYIVLWLFSMATGLCFLEVMTWMKGSKSQVNMLSMTESILGHIGKIPICFVYLFLFYSLLIAYFCEGGNILCRIFNCQSLEIPWVRHLGPLGFAVLMGPIIMAGTKVVDYCNRFFMFGLAVAFGIFCVLGFLKIQPSFLLRSSWLVTMNAFPVFFLAFGFQNIVPTLYYYMDKNVRDVKKAIFIGTLIPLVLYILWEAVVLGAVSLPILSQAKVGGYTAMEALKQAYHSWAFYIAGELFGFFALVSSFVGAALGVMDFLADGLKWNKKSHPFSIFFLTFIIPLAWAICYPDIVLTCLKYAGGIGAAVIVGLFPILIVWKGRYGKQQHKEKRLVPGERFTLFLMFLVIVINVVSLYYKF